MWEYKSVYDAPMEDELKHYGVLGMKWGVRRASKKLSSATTKADKAKAKASLDKHYAKASKKLNKVSAKADKHLDKARKKAVIAEAGWGAGRRGRALKKANKHRRKALGNMKKADKWIKSMDKVFKDTPIEVAKEQREIGKRYIDTLNTRVMARY